MAVTAVLVAATAVSVQTASGARAGCDATNQCVIMVQVDGLEPKDVTPESTPFMWSLAHPEQAGVGGNGLPALAGRHGWVWQAPRSVMSSSTAANTIALLTGSPPSVGGVTADAFRLDEPRRLGSLAEEEQIAQSDVLAEDIFDITGGDEGILSFAFSGDPALKPLLDSAREVWTPVDNTDGQPDPSPGPPNPAYCSVPQRPSQQDGLEAEGSCAANDMETLDKTQAQLAAFGDQVGFTFVHLAELGKVKRAAGDVDRPAGTEEAGDQPVEDPETGQAAADGATVAHSLAQTDSAMAAFVNRLNASQPDMWKNTVVMVVGSHGYETTPPALRVPHPSDASKTLEDYVEDVAGGGLAPQEDGLDLVPQGSLATVYYTKLADPAKRAQTVRAVRDALLDPDSGPNSTSACESTGGCIDEVLFTDPADGAENVQAKHPTWQLKAADAKGTPTGADGDLLVVMKRGWAAGRLVPANSTQVGTEEAPPASNPYMASAGGPRNRAVAALVNGPDTIVRQVGAAQSDGRYPVTNGPAGNMSNPPQDPQPAADLNKANASPGDDARGTGHELQPETVDFAPTALALMGFGIPTRQFEPHGGRFLQEAFIRKLDFPCEVDCEPEPAPPPDPPAPPISIIRAEAKDPFNFHGLLRGLKARVVDANGRPYRAARAGARLSSLLLEADFGKPRSQVTLSFYNPVKKGRGKRGRSSRSQLKTMATFKPFTISRGHVKFRLKVPEQFKPSYVGVTVQQVRPRPAPPGQKGAANFVGFGAKAGAIVKIKDGGRLHTLKQRRKGGTKRRGGRRGVAAG